MPFGIENYVDAILRETGGRGVDVVFDAIGGNTLSRSPDTLAQLGRVVTIVDTRQQGLGVGLAPASLAPD